MSRNNKGQFQKGEVPEGAVPFSEGVAKEMQRRSAKARKENRTLREALRDSLEKRASSGSEMSKLEYLVEKAISNHANGKLTFKDLKNLASVLGEDTLNINTNGPQVIVVSQQAIEASKKWGK